MIWKIENKATITGFGLGLVAEMNLVESRTGGGDESGGNRTGGGYKLQVDSDWHDGVYGLGLVVNMAATMKLVWWWYMAATMMMMRW